MNKKKLITMLTALALVGAIGVGATLAYLSDKTQELTNTFTFTNANIDITLDEAKVDENTNKALEDGSRISEGDKQDYKNIIPGMIIDKDPTVYVEAGKLSCNVFVSVKNPNLDTVLKINAKDEEDKDAWADAAWALIDATEYGYESENLPANTKYYVYQGIVATGDKDAGDELKVVPTLDEKTPLEDVFKTVTVGTTVNKDTEIQDIVIKAAAVQADSCTDDEAIKTALDLLISAN